MKTKEKPVRKGLSVKTICYCAVFVALSIVTNVYTVYLSVGNSNALSFNYTVCFLAGAFFGPVAGFIVGACGDVLGWLINSTGGAFNPVVTLVTGLIGLIPGLVFTIARKLGRNKNVFALTVISFILIFLICTNLNTVAMYFYYMSGKYSFWAYYVVRTPKQAIFWAINLACSLVLVKPFQKLIKA
ncbi:MAG: folate family ECF transporter S component [Christensenellales bacterium]